MNKDFKICPRLEHFRRLETDGRYGVCGHMVSRNSFDTLEELEDSKWLESLKQKMNNNIWPDECIRCQLTEQANGSSIRLNAIERDQILKNVRKDYLIIGGTLDNYCNSACISCNTNLSTRIGILEKDPIINDNYIEFTKMPQERIVELDINGGEPSLSKNYKKVLANLSSYVKIVRVNTNGSRYIKELELLLDKKIKVIITLSLDGIGQVHDYLRWPIKWVDYKKMVEQYCTLREENSLCSLDFWTTVSSLNINDLPNIIEFANSMNIPHQYGILQTPNEMNIKYKNKFTNRAKNFFNELEISVDIDNSDVLEKFLDKQDKIRNIKRQDYGY